jgi:multidrug resistance efflux pump
MYLLGLTLLVATLLGARALTAGHGNADHKTPEPPAAGGGKATGPVVLGTVESDTPMVQYGNSPVLQSGTITQVFVKEGQEVTAGNPEKGIPASKLYEFDSTILRHDLERAQIAVLQAENEVAKAKEAKKQHEKKIKAMEQTVAAAKTKVETATKLYHLIKNNLEKQYESNKIDPSMWPQKLADNPELFKANADYVDALNARDRLEAEYEILKSADVQLVVNQAEIGVKQAKAEEAKAKTAVDLCTVTAKTDGVVEQIKISPGTTMGIGTRDPALWIIPSGPRVVHGELEAEFAHRVTPDIVGKEVAIFDHNDPKLMYKGTVRRIGETFLPKRSSDNLLGNDTRVLPVEIVVDKLPAGDKRPPLRVGQRVRVSLGQ